MRLLGPYFVLLLAGLSGCQSKPDYTPHGTTLVQVERGAQHSRTITTRIANLLTIGLPAPDPVGYIWEIAAHDTRILKQRSELAPTGPGGAWQVNFFVLRGGRTRVRFVLVPPAGTVRDPVDLEEVVVSVE
jgi:hypothetical protein